MTQIDKPSWLLNWLESLQSALFNKTSFLVHNGA